MLIKATNRNSSLNSFFQVSIQQHPHSLSLSPPTLSLLPSNKSISLLSITAIHAARSAKNSLSVEESKALVAPGPPSTGKWTLDSWKKKKASQLPEYPDANSPESVLKTIEAFPPIVFAGEARSLEERLAEEWSEVAKL